MLSIMVQVIRVITKLIYNADRVRGMLRDVSTTPPSVGDAKGPDIGIIIGGTALALVVVIAVVATLIVAIIVAMVVRNRRDEFKLKSTRCNNRYRSISTVYT